MAKNVLLILFGFLIACSSLVITVVGARHPLHLTDSSARKNEETGVSPFITILKYGSKILVPYVPYDSIFGNKNKDPTTPSMTSDSGSETEHEVERQCDDEEKCEEGSCEHLKIDNCECSDKVLILRHPFDEPYCMPNIFRDEQEYAMGLNNDPSGSGTGTGTDLTFIDDGYNHEENNDQMEEGFETDSDNGKNMQIVEEEYYPGQGLLVSDSVQGHEDENDSEMEEGFETDSDNGKNMQIIEEEYYPGQGLIVEGEDNETDSDNEMEEVINNNDSKPNGNEMEAENYPGEGLVVYPNTVTEEGSTGLNFIDNYISSNNNVDDQEANGSHGEGVYWSMENGRWVPGN